MKAIAHLEPSVGSCGRRPERPRAITKMSTFGVRPISSPSEIPSESFTLTVPHLAWFNILILLRRALA